jgi:hypothetical protein
MSSPFAMLAARFDRRMLLRLGLGASALVVLSVVGAGFGLLSPRTPGRSRRVLTDDEALFLDAAADALFPPGNAVGVDGRDVGVPDGADMLLSGLPPNAVRVFHAVMSLLDLWPVLAMRSLSRFSALPLDERVAIFRDFDASALEARRGLVSLVRVLVSMFVFERPEALVAIGHRSGCIGVNVDDGSTP